MELITQSELAKRLGKSKQYIAKLKKKGVFKKCFDGKKIKYECALKAMEENIKDFKKTDPRQFKKEIQKSIPKEIPQIQELIYDAINEALEDLQEEKLWK